MGTFSIWHWIILLCMLAIPATVVGIIVWAIRRSRRTPPPPVRDVGLVAQVVELDRLHREGAIDTDEHARRRAALLAGR
ncbi:hypothetical protein [Luteimonas sp. FCS-9]|uniref:hypothetical protein n=1 Tax=Luteimonas sp. FCS-9 TaxID=1547516 RepID=UPI00063EBFF9|nr:hypothetical protein [Luteimonas sp. FCS-9]KLJ02871.1 hypothetical protein WQ56_00925 [Luteimonas sp. FCS-9]